MTQANLLTSVSGAAHTPGGKWCVQFITLAGNPGNQHVVARTESAAVFDSANDAYAGGARALTVLEATGAFPNMCEPF